MRRRGAGSAAAWKGASAVRTGGPRGRVRRTARRPECRAGSGAAAVAGRSSGRAGEPWRAVRGSRATVRRAAAGRRPSGQPPPPFQPRPDRPASRLPDTGEEPPRRDPLPCGSHHREAAPRSPGPSALARALGRAVLVARDRRRCHPGRKRAQPAEGEGDPAQAKCCEAARMPGRASSADARRCATVCCAGSPSRLAAQASCAARAAPAGMTPGVLVARRPPPLPAAPFRRIRIR
jgi:hypothetical protein